MSKSCSVKPRSQVRGVIPTKVSDLENDLQFVSQEQLDRIANLTGYTGKDSDTTTVLVDNLARTIEVIAKLDLLTNSLPKDTNGNFKDGTYLLRASVANGIPVLEWGESSGSGSGTSGIGLYYYGQVEVSSLDELTGDLVKGLSPDGPIKGDREFKFTSKNQRQVFAYPKDFGELSSIVHKETGFNVTGSFEVIDLVIDGIPYYIYISYNPSTGSYTYQFKY